MSQKQPDAFRDFGILPEGIQPPPESIRSFLSPGRILGQYIGTGLVSAFGLGLALLFGLFLPFPLNLLGCTAALMGFAAFVYLATHNDYRWVELDGQTLRAKQLYTGRIVERSLEEIDSLVTMVYPIRRKETRVIEYFLGRVKGIEVRFRDGRTPLRILRSDPAMTNAKELIEALVYKMGKIREVEAERVTFAGNPLVRQIYWKNEQPNPSPKKTLKICLACLLSLALMFGLVLGFWGRAADKLQKLTSVPPRQTDLATLIEKGPESNPHVQLTDFQFGGYVVETQKGRWTSVWIALFPKSPKGRLPGRQAEQTKEIKAVLICHKISNEDAFRQFLRQERVLGICSDSLGSPGGPTRTKLLESNPGSQLSSVWYIEESSEPPSVETVQRILWGSSACFLVAILCAAVLFVKRT